MLDSLLENIYWLIYAGTIIEGETAVLLGTVAAQQGLIELRWLLAVAFAGALTGDQVSYQLFRRFGPALVERSETLKRRTEKARRLLSSHPVKFIFLTRFLWGLRLACMLALAASDVRTRVFAPVNIVACLVWAFVVSGVGYAFSSSITRIIQAMDGFSGRVPAILAGIAVFMAAVVLIRMAVLRFWRSRETL